MKRKTKTGFKKGPRYHSPGWKTVYLRWRHSCQCQQESASSTFWSGGDASAAACTWPSPSGQPSADQSRSGCRWSPLSEGKFEHQLTNRGSDKAFKSVLASLAHLPTTCGSVEASRSSMMVPFSMQVLSSIKLCKESVATWGLLQRSPPFSTFSSNLIHLDRGGQKIQFGYIYFTGPPCQWTSWKARVLCQRMWNLFVCPGTGSLM